jgi:signal transduction histidine kinase
MPAAAPALQMGLRLQIVLALGALTLLAFGPLFFAVASLTRASVIGVGEQAAREESRAIAVHVDDVLARGDLASLRSILRRQAAAVGVRALCAFDGDGRELACEGAAADVAAIGAAPPGQGDLHALRNPSGREIDVTTPLAGGGALVVRRDRVEGANRTAPLVGLVALYMGVFALALGVFTYFALTRLIVRPVDDLVAAADRVASGARTLRAPRTGARELLDLGASVRAMAEKLIAEEAALLVKIDELTETTTRLTETQAQLVRSERLASVGRLAAGLAHEIGNPLAALIGMQDLLIDGELPYESQRDFLQRMRRETERIHVVVRDLLDFARPEGPASQGLATAGAESASDVSRVAQDVLSLVGAQRSYRELRIGREIEPGTRVALAPPRLTQVLLNIVLNAAAALAGSGRAGGRITIRARPLDARSVRIDVEDDGPGVAAQIRDRLFEPFATTKEVGDGTGLGLAVCRGLVESAGGQIGLDPSYGSGARFYVVLPSG